MTEREIMVDVAKRYVGTFYRWGGDDPEGFDCSGLVIECLKSVGLFPRRQDATAHDLWRRYSPVAVPQPGDLVFWRRTSNARIHHVGLVIDPPHLYIGAEGGSSTTTTLEEAIRRNAFIKIRPLKSRGPIRIYADPFAQVT